MDDAPQLVRRIFALALARGRTQEQRIHDVTAALQTIAETRGTEGLASLMTCALAMACGLEPKTRHQPTAVFVFAAETWARTKLDQIQRQR